MSDAHGKTQQSIPVRAIAQTFTFSVQTFTSDIRVLEQSEAEVAVFKFCRLMGMTLANRSSAQCPPPKPR